MEGFKNHKIIIKDSYKTTVSEIIMVKPILDKEGLIKYWKPVKDKYYTPDIEEFHVGFEYEVLIDGSWIRFVCDKHFCLTNVYSNYSEKFSVDEKIKDNKCRVKYLDVEDLDSLGFEIPPVSLPNFHINYSLSCSMMFSNKDALCRLDMLNSKHKMKTSYLGKIKNKSELKRLLKQLEL